MANVKRISENLYQITDKNGNDCTVNKDQLSVMVPTTTKDGTYNIFQKGLASEPVNVTKETYREFVKDLHDKEDEKLQK